MHINVISAERNELACYVFDLLATHHPRILICRVGSADSS